MKIFRENSDRSHERGLTGDHESLGGLAELIHEIDRDELPFVRLTASGPDPVPSITKSYIYEVELTPEEILAALFCLPPGVIGKALPKAFAELNEYEPWDPENKSPERGHIDMERLVELQGEFVAGLTRAAGESARRDG